MNYSTDDTAGKMEEDGLPVERRASRASKQEEQDEGVLAEFGYKQELKREWGLLHNFGISFSIIVGFSFPLPSEQLC